MENPETSVSLLELNSRIDQLDAIRRRSEMVDAIYQTGTVLGLGLLMYLGWWTYRFSGDMQVSVRNSLGDLAPVDFPSVNPWLSTRDARDAYAESLGAEEPGDAEKLGEALLAANPLARAIVGLSPGDPSHRARKLVADFEDAQRFIDPETGAFTGYTSSYYMLKKAEAALVAAGFIAESDVEQPHLVDQVANFVVNDKWYWGGVLGLASIPPLSLGIKKTREMVKSAAE